jgi:hypothetical protein|tara:strand:- start:8104 stop:8346 length:243 start_codon:yes stop_codon:yes gene_type:complete
MNKQKEIITYSSDIDIIISAARSFTQVSEKTLSRSQVMNAFDAFHHVQRPMLRNYQEVSEVRNILENFDKKLKENYSGQY